VHNHPHLRYAIASELRRGLDERAALMSHVDRGRPLGGVASRLGAVARHLVRRPAAAPAPTVRSRVA
jgi:hypothetical protein